MKRIFNEVASQTNIDKENDDALIAYIKDYFNKKDNVELVMLETQGDEVTMAIRAKLDTDEESNQYKREEGKQLAYDIKYKLEQELQNKFAYTPLSIRGVQIRTLEDKDSPNIVEFEINFIYKNSGNTKLVTKESKNSPKTFLDEVKEDLIKEIEEKTGKKVILEDHSNIQKKAAEKILNNKDIDYTLALMNKVFKKKTNPDEFSKFERLHKSVLTKLVNAYNNIVITQPLTYPLGSYEAYQNICRNLSNIAEGVAIEENNDQGRPVMNLGSHVSFMESVDPRDTQRERWLELIKSLDKHYSEIGATTDMEDIVEDIVAEYGEEYRNQIEGAAREFYQLGKTKTLTEGIIRIVKGREPVNDSRANRGVEQKMSTARIIEWLTNSEERTDDEVLYDENSNAYFADDLAGKIVEFKGKRYSVNRDAEILNEGNPLTNDLPPRIDSFLQDIAQMTGLINYTDIFNFKPTPEQIKELINLRRKFNYEYEMQGKELEESEAVKKIVNIVKGKAIKEYVDDETIENPEFEQKYQDYETMRQDFEQDVTPDKDEEEEEIKWKETDGKLDYSKISNISIDGIDYKDAPDFVDAYIENADYDGRPMTDSELEDLNDDNDYVYEQVIDWIY